MVIRNRLLAKTLIQTAVHSPCNYRIGAIAFDKKGDVLGNACNTFRMGSKFIGEQNRKGTGFHAEARLIKRYKTNIKTILIMRIGNSGNILPINPCPACAKLAEKLGIKIVTVMGRNGKNILPRIFNVAMN